MKREIIKKEGNIFFVGRHFSGVFTFYQSIIAPDCASFCCSLK